MVRNKLMARKSCKGAPPPSPIVRRKLTARKSCGGGPRTKQMAMKCAVPVQKAEMPSAAGSLDHALL
ncbi:hypothetical protein M3Y99_00297000 [Aphelenchoides fujianensis]|nr:hypothetical protein M3Y99_00297000 [Aphelenchoides fujianensis]